MIWTNFKNIASMKAKLTNEKKQMLLLQLNKSQTSSRLGLLRIVLRQFYLNSRRGGIVKAVMGRLFQTKFGGVYMSFSKWKTLPEPRDDESYKAASMFQTKLHFFFRRNLKKYSLLFILK